MKKINLLKLLISFLGFIFTGCYSYPFTIPVTPAERIDIGNFSFLTPSGENWRTGKQSYMKDKTTKYYIPFVKPLYEERPVTESDTEMLSMSARIRVFPINEDINKEMLLDILKPVLSSPSPEYKTLESQYSFDETFESPCIRYKSRREINKLARFQDSLLYISDVLGLICVHPKYHNEVINLFAAQMYMKNRPSPAPSKDFEIFLNSLQFK